MSSKKFFTVVVPGKAAPVQFGFLDDEGKPKGDVRDGHIEVGEIAVPNYSVVWANQVKDKKTGLITGDLDFYEWGDPRGYQVEIRYLKNCRSLDMEFQRDIKKLKGRDEDAEIPLFVGLNDYDPIKDAFLVEMVKYHYQNGSNKSRNPQAKIAFETYDADKITKKQVTDMERRQAAERIVLAARENNEALEVLAVLFDIDPRKQPDILFRELVAFTESYEHFHKVIDYKRERYEEIALKAKELELIDVEPDNAIWVYKNGGREMLIGDIEHGADDKLSYVLLNYYKPEFFTPLVTLEALYTEYEKAVLN
jgi:hypothetical protein